MRRKIRARCEKQNTVRHQGLIKDSAENKIDRSYFARVSHVAPEPKFITFALSMITVPQLISQSPSRRFLQVNPDVFLFDNDTV